MSKTLKLLKAIEKPKWHGKCVIIKGIS